MKKIYKAFYCFQLILSVSLISSANLMAQSKPNILVILLDDARYDSYGVNGGPDWFLTPSIDRIAQEGVNFKNTFATYSLCTPSRGSMLTGLYPHKHGAVNNDGNIYPWVPTVSEILHNDGYTTAIFGKYQMALDPQPGWDDWFVAAGEDYTDGKFNHNGDLVQTTGHKTDILTDSVVNYIMHSNSSQPFFLWLAHNAPHTPYEPRPQDAGIFDADVMPFPDNFVRYQYNFPNFYWSPHYVIADTTNCTDGIRGYYELLNGVEESVSKILDALEQKGILDSTMVIFTSDNGHLDGEHQLNVKRLSQEESIRLPLFIRYPKWFAADSVVTDPLVLNIDLAPTMLDAAGIPDTFHMDGISVHEFYNGDTTRKLFYYEVIHNDSLVNLRCVCTTNRKYTYYYCDQLTEEFFDLDVDPEENRNFINHLDRTDEIQSFRDKLDSLRIALNDTFTDVFRECYLAHPHISQGNGPDDTPVGLPSIYVLPNPAQDEIDIQFPFTEDNKVDVYIFNSVGQTMLANLQLKLYKLSTNKVNVSTWAQGLYFITLYDGNAWTVGKFVIQRQ